MFHTGRSVRKQTTFTVHVPTHGHEVATGRALDMASLPSFAPEQLETLLAQALRPSTETIRQVEAELRRALAKPTFICDLFDRLQHSAHAEIRQMAAVLVRRRISTHWLRLEANVRHELQAVLLQRLANEPERVVRRSMTSVVAVVAKYALPKGQWPELLGFLFECTQSAAAEHRELSMLLLASLFDSDRVVDACLRPHFAALATTLQSLLADSLNSSVRHATLKAVGAWANLLIGKPLAPTHAPHPGSLKIATFHKYFRACTSSQERKTSVRCGLCSHRCSPCARQPHARQTRTRCRLHWRYFKMCSKQHHRRW